jgi:hypothetical protein
MLTQLALRPLRRPCTRRRCTRISPSCHTCSLTGACRPLGPTAKASPPCTAHARAGTSRRSISCLSVAREAMIPRRSSATAARGDLTGKPRLGGRLSVSLAGVPLIATRVTADLGRTCHSVRRRKWARRRRRASRQTSWSRPSRPLGRRRDGRRHCQGRV